MQKITDTKNKTNVQKNTRSEVSKPRTSLSQKVKWSREQAGWTQEAAAAAMGVSRETFNRWETGCAVIPPAKLHKLKHLAHVNFAEFRPALVYDKDGFPHPFTKAAYDAALTSAEESGGTQEIDALDDRLVVLEGREYPDREWVRVCLAHPTLVLKRVDFDKDNAKYFTKLAIEHGW